MSKSTIVGIAGVLVLAVIVLLALQFGGPTIPLPEEGRPLVKQKPDAPAATPSVAAPAAGPKQSEPIARGKLTAAEKAARIEKIKRDYDEVRVKTSGEYSAAGAAFPGGLNAFLRQLALLEREKRADLAEFLTTGELEDLEMRETSAGQLVQRLLGEVPLTDAQRRTVFRLQRAYEDRFALTFDLTPKALFAREAARQEVQEQIRAVIGDGAFAAWLKGEGDDFSRFTAFAKRHGLPPDAPLDLWRAKNDFTLQRLDLMAKQPGSKSTDQLRAAQAALTHQMEARVLGVVGPGLMEKARSEVLGWLPRKW